jgi:hypothetical protein
MKLIKKKIKKQIESSRIEPPNPWFKLWDENNLIENKSQNSIYNQSMLNDEIKKKKSIRKKNSSQSS